MGLLDSFKNKSGIPEELEQFLTMALENGEISDKELGVLRAKAEKYGISNDELDMIIKNRLLHDESKKKTIIASIADEEVDGKIASNRYCATDDTEVIFNKYQALCNLQGLNLNKDQAKRVHNAKVVYINSIEAPQTKEALIQLVIRMIPLSKNSTANETAKVATEIGFTAAKSISFAAKVATLGLASSTVNKVQNLAMKAIMTNEAELAAVWKTKAKQVLAVAKQMEGGVFSKDTEFSARIKELAKGLE